MFPSAGRLLSTLVALLVSLRPALVARHGARRLETPDQTRGSEGEAGSQREPFLTPDADDRARVGVRMVAHHRAHRYENTQCTRLKSFGRTAVSR
jgi:hypothetical protein